MAHPENCALPTGLLASYSLRPVRGSLLCTKDLFVAARTVVQGPQSSRGERDRLGFGLRGVISISPVLPTATIANRLNNWDRLYKGHTKRG
jgi:hypothetical protein